VDFGLRGKSAYVTGAARGIGEAIAGALAGEGVHLAASDIDQDVLERKAAGWTVDGAPPVTLRADLSTERGCVSAAEQAISGLGGPPDVLVNNVGTGVVRTFEEIPDSGWVDTLSLNFLSYVRTSRVLVPEMARAGGGAVVNIASDLAKQPEPVPADYAASKAAVLSLTKSLSLEYAPDVRVNAVCPGPIWTHLWTRPGGFADSLGELYDLPPEQAVEKFIAERHLPLARIGEPADVAAVTLFLASDLSKYVTSSSYNVDGGSIRSLL
jgi:NAD(P)-dependent dehydrogenase (short-subunit alcohol dehydrogenase family)